MPMAALRQAAPFPLVPAVAGNCLGPAAMDAVFARGWRQGPASLTRAGRSAVAAVTGHVAVPVTGTLPGQRGWHVLWHFTGPGAARRRPGLPHPASEANVIATALGCHEPTLFHLVNAHVGVTVGGTTG